MGSGRVTFNNSRAYMRAVTAAFIEIKTAKFTKKVQVSTKILMMVGEKSNVGQNMASFRVKSLLQ